MMYKPPFGVTSKTPVSFKYKADRGRDNIIIVNDKKIRLPSTKTAGSISPYFIHDLLIFHINYRIDKISEENLIAINSNGDIVWKFNEDNYLNVKHGFSKPWRMENVDDESDMWTKNFAGKEYKIDYKTGKVIETKYENLDFDFERDTVRIGDKKIELTIPEGVAEIEQAFSWRGELLFVKYKNGAVKERQSYIEHQSYLDAFDNHGKHLWSLSNKDFGVSFRMHDVIHNLYLTTHYHDYEIDKHTGAIIKKEVSY